MPKSQKIKSISWKIWLLFRSWKHDIRRQEIQEEIKIYRFRSKNDKRNKVYGSAYFKYINIDKVEVDKYEGVFNVRAYIDFSYYYEWIYDLRIFF